MRTYRGVIVVSHSDEIEKEHLIRHLAERAMLEIDLCEVDGLQVVILWRSLVDLDSDT